MPSTCSDGMASAFSGTPESVIALAWIVFDDLPELSLLVRAAA
jgi:hypothetical protein